MWWLSSFDKNERFPTDPRDISGPVRHRGQPPRKTGEREHRVPKSQTVSDPCRSCPGPLAGRWGRLPRAHSRAEGKEWVWHSECEAPWRLEHAVLTPVLFMHAFSSSSSCFLPWLLPFPTSPGTLSKVEAASEMTRPKAASSDSNVEVSAPNKSVGKPLLFLTDYRQGKHFCSKRGLVCLMLGDNIYPKAHVPPAAQRRHVLRVSLQNADQLGERPPTTPLGMSLTESAHLHHHHGSGGHLPQLLSHDFPGELRSSLFLAVTQGRCQRLLPARFGGWLKEPLQAPGSPRSPWGGNNAARKLSTESAKWLRFGDS